VGISKEKSSFEMFIFQLADCKGTMRVNFCSGGKILNYMPLAVCLIHWEICRCNALVHLGMALSWMYPEG
jgi:hypothetical protein